jgi:hypothetical protein
MPKRRKPASFLRYMSGQVDRDTAAKSVLVYCLGAEGYRCRHIGKLKLADIPDGDWHDISARLKCTECGTIGWVDVRFEAPTPRMGTNAW